MGRVGERGQITIEKAIRDRLGIKPRDIAVQEVVDGRMVVHFLPAPHRRSLYGALKPQGRRPVKDWRKVKEEAWIARVRERSAPVKDSAEVR
jgi:AbrB family looped-hinge helix DNA binding protein